MSLIYQAEMGETMDVAMRKAIHADCVRMIHNDLIYNLSWEAKVMGRLVRDDGGLSVGGHFLGGLPRSEEEKCQTSEGT